MSLKLVFQLVLSQVQVGMISEWILKFEDAKTVKEANQARRKLTDYLNSMLALRGDPRCKRELIYISRRTDMATQDVVYIFSYAEGE